MAALDRPATVPASIGPASIGLVIAAYRAEQEIGQTLAAVAAQTRLPDQVIVVDDASGDGTAIAAKRWQDVLPLEVVELPVNGGVARARNEAIRRLDTDLVAILDGDDLPLPDHLLTLADLHARHGGIVSARACFWSPGTPPRPYQRRVRGLSTPERDQLRHLVRRNFVFVAALVARADLLEVGGFTEGDRSQDTTADWDLWLKLMAAGSGVSMPAVPTVLYRVRPGSMADDHAHLLRCEILQLERSRALVGPALGAEVDRAIADRRAQLRLLDAIGASDRRRVALARLALRSEGGNWRHRSRALAHLVAPGVAERLLHRRGSW